MIGKYWISVRDGDPRVRGMYNRHYSSYQYKDGRHPLKTVGPGEYICLLTVDCRALFIWRKFIDASGQEGINCAVFRNEGEILSSTLILEAEEWSFNRWPGERLYTYINSKGIESTNPGYCFKMAGWEYIRDSEGKPVRTKKSSLYILEKLSQCINLTLSGEWK